MTGATPPRFVCSACGEAAAAPGPCPRDGTAMVDRRHDALLGMHLGPYRLAQCIGAGGMGRVYRAVHPEIGSRVAIKVLAREAAANPLGVDRFFAEARAVNIIRHEHIVNVLDLGTLPDGRPYSVMEFLDGTTLTARITPPARPSLAEVGAWFGQVLSAIGAAHAKQVLHRDLKPDNVFISPGGQAKVLDFGIAKLRPELGGAQSQSLHILGTPAYMAPEQATGQGVLDGRADLYAIGVMLYEALAGARPFDATADFELLRMHLEEAPPPLRDRRPDLPPGVEHVVHVALAKDPAARFRTAEAMATALASALGAARPSGTLVPVVPAPPVAPAPAPTAVTRAERPARLAPPAAVASAPRARWPWVLGAVVVLGGGGAAVALRAGRASPRPALAPSAPVAASAAPLAGERVTAAEGFAVILPPGYVAAPSAQGLVARRDSSDSIVCAALPAGVPYTADALVGALIGGGTATLPLVAGSSGTRTIDGVARPRAVFGDARARSEVVFYEGAGAPFYCAVATAPARFDDQAALRDEVFTRRVVAPDPTAAPPVAAWPPRMQQRAAAAGPIDVDATLAATLAELRPLAPDLVPIYVLVNGVGADGIVRGERGQLTIQLASPRHATEAVCGVIVLTGASIGWVASPMNSGCRPPLPRPPRCGMAALWRKAQATGKVPASAVEADVLWGPPGAARGAWLVMVGRAAFEVPDDC